MHWIISLIIDPSGMSTLMYVSMSVILGILLLFIVHAVLFSVFALSMRSDVEHGYFEYSLRRRWLKSVLYVLLGVVLSAEIVAGWVQGWFTSWPHMIPLWIVLIVAIVMALARAHPFKRRWSYFQSLEKTVNANK